jgi:hypothetical protein
MNYTQTKSDLAQTLLNAIKNFSMRTDYVQLSTEMILNASSQEFNALPDHLGLVMQVQAR